MCEEVGGSSRQDTDCYKLVLEKRLNLFPVEGSEFLYIKL